MNTKKTIESFECSQIDAGGFTTTLDGVYDWAKAIVSDINDQFGRVPLSTQISMFRQFGSEFFQLIIWDEQSKNRHSISFQIGFPHNYHLTRVKAPDATEAMHMIGIVTSTIKSRSFIGNQDCEFNQYCIPIELPEGHTNGRLYIA